MNIIRFQIPQSFFFWLAIGGLVLSVILNSFNKQVQNHPQILVEQLEENLRTEIRITNSEATRIMRNLEAERLFARLNSRLTSTFFVFENEKLVYWNDHQYMPGYYQMSRLRNLSLLETDRGSFVLLKYKMEGGYEIFGLVDLYTQYSISNDYLISGFNTDLFPVDDGIIISGPDDEDGLPVSYLDKRIFSVNFNGRVNNRSETLGLFILVLTFLSFVSLGYFIWTRLSQKSKQGEFESGFFLWIVTLFFLRYLTLLLEIPDVIVETGLFGSMFFAASSLSPSLGDLLINVILLNLILLFLFRHYTQSEVLKRILITNTNKKLIAAVVMMVLGFYFLWYPHLIIQTIYNNSQLSLDITESTAISFPRMISLLIFLLSTLSLFIGLHVLYRILFQLIKGNHTWFFGCLLTSIVIFSGVQIIMGAHYFIVLISGVFLYTILYFTRVFKNFWNWTYNSFLYVFLIMTATGTLGAYGIFEFENSRENQNKVRFADYFLVKHDNLTEFYLMEASNRIREDLFISTRLASPFLSKEVIEAKIRQVHLGSLFDKYDINIGIYRSASEWLAGDSIPDSGLIINGRDMSDHITEYENIYYLNTGDEEPLKRYISKIDVERRGNVVGTIILDLTLKKVIPNDVYFELLVDNRFTEPWQGSEMSYAVFTPNRIAYNSGEFNYDFAFREGVLQTDGFTFEGPFQLMGYNHVAMRDQESNIIVVSSPTYPFWRMITNYSFLFLIQVTVLLLLAVIYVIHQIYNRTNLNYSAKIQLYFNLSFILPVLIVSIVTLSLINNIFKEEVSYEFNEKAANIAENIAPTLDRYRSGETDREALMQKILEVSRFTDVDVNLFNPFGELLATSQPLIYENELLSRYLNPHAYARMVERDDNEWITTEYVGNLHYNATYIAVNSYETGNFLGVLSVPYFESEVHLERQQIEIVSSIINIFTLVFIGFVLISYIVSKGLTFPLRLITQKLKKTSLNKVNEPITWKSEDEIGLMVGEYNRMVKNLEESKRELAKTEKESAWREIAQQVAHEIKNPLTPMKLTLQHLERKLIETNGDAQKPIKNLLHHIDTLDDIASSFSSFARMPIPENEPFELMKVLKNSIGLHKNLENVEISLESDVKSKMVWGDKKLMGRIFSNIILNASQSGEAEQKINVDIHVSEQDRKTLVEVSDDGMGIEESIRGKIFFPNFTTKEKGSGIGLSIAKHGIEHADGKIWFETETGKGTTFYIELRNANA